MRESVTPRRAVAGVAGAALLALLLVGTTLRGRGGALVELEEKAGGGEGQQQVAGAGKGGAAVHTAQSLIYREGHQYLPGRGNEKDLVPGSSTYHPPDTSQAPHATIKDRGFWWGDNDAWHDGWTQHKEDGRRMKYAPPSILPPNYSTSNP